MTFGKLKAKRSLGRCWFVSVLLALSIGEACTAIDSTLTLEPGAVIKSASVPGNPLFLARVTDRRKDQQRIGIKRSGLGSESANLYLDVPLTDWLGGLINVELKKAGFTLVGPEVSPATRIEVDVLDFFIEPISGFMRNYDVWGAVQIEVTVRLPDGSAFARRFAGVAHDSFTLPTDGSYEDQILGAVRMVLNQLVPDVAQLVVERGGASRASWRAGRDWRRTT